MVDESKEYLSDYYKQLESKFVPLNDLMINMKKVLNGKMTENEYEEILNTGNRCFIESHKTLQEVILKNLLEEYITCEYIINTKKLKGKDNETKYMIYSRYNIYQYIIECIKADLVMEI